MNSTELFLIQMGAMYAQMRLSTDKALNEAQKAALMAAVTAGQEIAMAFAK